MARRMGYEEQLHAIAEYFKEEIEKFDALPEEQKKEAAHKGLMEIGLVDADGNLTEPYRLLRERYGYGDTNSELSSPKDISSQKDLLLSDKLAQKAKHEMEETGAVKTVCPKCGKHPVVKITGRYGERVIVRCECGFVSCQEYGI